MSDTYFNYALSQWRREGIKLFCEVYSTKACLINAATQPFNSCADITDDWRLLDDVTACLQSDDTIDCYKLSNDAKQIYKRCQSKIKIINEELNYDELFDCLVDMNWLLASIEKSKGRNRVQLLSDSWEIRRYLKEYLFGLYNSAISDKNECVYIQEAKNARKKFCPGLYPFQYKKSRDYVERYENIELDIMENDYREKSLYKMSLFFGLTATAALAENIRSLR